MDLREFIHIADTVRMAYEKRAGPGMKIGECGKLRLALQQQLTGTCDPPWERLDDVPERHRAAVAAAMTIRFG